MDLIGAYHARCASGSLKNDPAQQHCLEALAPLLAPLSLSPLRRFGVRIWQTLSRQHPWQTPLRGAYIYGGVGTGKTMLMDHCFAMAPEPKRRLHNHVIKSAWLESAHAIAQNEHATASRYAKLANDCAHATRLLCWDEVELTDIADAMIFGRVLRELARYPLIVLMTSNRTPDQLYQGLHAEMFRPTAEWMRHNLLCLPLDGGHDYRRDSRHHDSQKSSSDSLWFTMSPTDQITLQARFENLAYPHRPQRRLYAFAGRKLVMNRVAGGVAWATFAELCEHPLGSRDFQVLAQHLHTLFLTEIPDLTTCPRDPIRRFIGLIDSLYDHKVRLVLGLNAPLTNPGGTWEFEFARTLSRLTEMRYWSQP